MRAMIFKLCFLLYGSNAADIVFGAKQEQVESLYGTKVDVECSVNTGMKITLEAPFAARNMRFALTDPECVLEKNGNYHTISTHLSGCGNDIFIDSSTLTIINQITNIMGFGTSPVKVTSRVGCLFHQQEISIGAILKEHIPPEIVPGAVDEFETTTLGTTYTTTSTTTLQTTSTTFEQVSLKDRSGDGDDEKDKPTDGGRPDIRRGNGTKPIFEEEDELKRTTLVPETEKVTPTRSYVEEEMSTSSFATTPLTSTEATSTETEFSSVQTVEYDTATPQLTVNVDIITTTTDEPVTKATDEPVTMKPAGPRPTFSIPQRAGGHTLAMPCKGRKCKDKTRPTKSPRTRKTRPTKAPKTSVPEKTAPILIPTQTPEKVAEEDVIVPCNEGEKFKEHKCVNTTYDMPWRSQAEGKGLFFAKMFLYPDSEYDQPFAHPPVLGTNDTVFIGVQLMGGPPATTLSVKSCWASNMYHSPLELSTSRKNSEVTLDLINDSCAVKYPEGLVSILTNGQEKIAKFTSGVFQFVDHDTAYLYCRIRICPTGPCPNDCSSGRERREFDEPVFEALVQSSDPYKIHSGPLLGATIYREPNRKNAEMEVVEIEVLDGKSEAEIEERFSFGDIIRNSTLTQAILIGALGFAIFILLVLSILVIRRQNQIKIIN